MTEKIATYVIWRNRLPVFHEPDYPKAGTRVPGGTVEEGEPPDIWMSYEEDP